MAWPIVFFGEMWLCMTYYFFSVNFLYNANWKLYTTNLHIYITFICKISYQLFGRRVFLTDLPTNGSPGLNSRSGGNHNKEEIPPTLHMLFKHWERKASTQIYCVFNTTLTQSQRHPNWNLHSLWTGENNSKNKPSNWTKERGRKIIHHDQDWFGQSCKTGLSFEKSICIVTILTNF